MIAASCCVGHICMVGGGGGCSCTVYSIYLTTHRTLISELESVMKLGQLFGVQVQYFRIVDISLPS